METLLHLSIYPCVWGIACHMINVYMHVYVSDVSDIVYMCVCWPLHLLTLSDFCHSTLECTCTSASMLLVIWMVPAITSQSLGGAAGGGGLSL